MKMYNSWERESRKVAGRGCAAILGVIALVLVVAFAGPLVTMWLWNWVAVDLFAAPVITYWQALGLQWLCHILFGHTVTVKRD